MKVSGDCRFFAEFKTIEKKSSDNQSFTKVAKFAVHHKDDVHSNSVVSKLLRYFQLMRQIIRHPPEKSASLIELSDSLCHFKVDENYPIAKSLRLHIN
jgi:hypothetical protein